MNSIARAIACITWAAFECMHAGAQTIAHRPEQLQVENLDDPIGMDETAPRFSWTLNWDGAMQVAWQVRAASTSALLDRDAPDLWDSGMVAGTDPFDATYEGPSLQSRQRIVWQVRVWTGDTAVPSEWSLPAAFEMGLLGASDWVGRWITHPGWSFGQPMPVFARQFALTKPVRSARLYITGLGMCHATLNGRPVTEDVLTPGNTLYTRRVEYGTFDVTALLNSGGNLIRVELGNGMYNSVQTPGRYYGLINPRALDVKLIAQLEIRYADRSLETIGSDASWRTTLGPTIASTWFGGEDYDARRELGADSSGWEFAIATLPPEGAPELVWRPSPPVRVFETIRAISVNEPQPGVYVVDLGVNFAGWPQLRASAPPGTWVVMKLGELLGKDGLVREDTVGGNIYDTYIFSGVGVESWHPKFLYHGFRYVQITGLSSRPTLDTISGLVLRAANREAGEFESSNELLNDIHRIINRAIQSNMLSIFTDCPHREKLGWLGDMIGIFPSITRNYDVAAHMRTVMRNMADSQTENGMVPTFAPAYADYSIYGEGFRDDVNWGSAMILAPWALYETYGDKRTMEIYYPRMQHYLAYLAGRAKGFLLDYGLGDWISPDETVPREVIATYGLYRCAWTMSRVAALLGRPSDADEYAKLARNIGDAFHRKYFDRERRYYANGQQAANGIALDMGIVPAEERAAVEDQLVAGIRGADNHFQAGIVSLQAILRALSAAGRDDVIFDAATQVTAPSYGYQVVNGATSLTEEWSGPSVGSSQNHMMLGAIDEWFTARLAGIRQAPGSVGFREVVIEPVAAGGLTHVRGSYRTPHGVIVSEWWIDESGVFQQRANR